VAEEGEGERKRRSPCRRKTPRACTTEKEKKKPAVPSVRNPLLSCTGRRGKKGGKEKARGHGGYGLLENHLLAWPPRTKKEKEKGEDPHQRVYRGKKR